MQDFEKLGVFYLGREYDPAQNAQGHAGPLRFQGPRDPRRLRGHDGQRQDGALHLPPGRGGDRRHPRHHHRSQRRPGQPAADVSGPAARGFPALDQRGRRRARRACRPTTFAAGQAELWKKGLADWGQDGGAHPAGCATAADFAIYTPGSSAGHPGLDPASFAAPPPAVAGRPRSCCASGSTTTVTSLLASSASRPTRCRAASTSCSPPSSTTPGQRAQDLDLAALIQQIQTAARSRSRRVRPRVVLSREGSVRAGDDAQQPAGRARVRGLAGGRAARHRPHALHPGGQAADVDLLDRPPGRRGADVLRHRSCSTRCSAGCAPSRAPPACGRCSTWTRSSATSRRWPIRRRRRRC